jgi:hypothetical protein
MKIITNNHPRDIIAGYELTEDERKEFDYIRIWEDAQFIRYKGELYDLNDLEQNPGVFPEWSAYISDTFFSGVLFKFVNDFEQVIMGRYYT